MHDEKPTETFNYSHLPEPVATSFSEALGCYRHGLLQAFAAMCRLTAQHMCDDLGEDQKLKMFDQVDEIASLADISDAERREIRNILFDNHSSSLHNINREMAAVMLEMMKELLHQAYIRRALLKQKLRMRRYFANPSDDIDNELDDPKVSPINRPTGSSRH